jgi:MFS family permease
MLQGVSAGGEWGGAVLLTVEYAGAGRRGVASSVAQIGLFSGVLLANGVFFLVSLLPTEQFLSWGWRVPFLGSVVLVGIALWIRLGVGESPVFERARRADAVSPRPLLDLVRFQWRSVLVVTLLMFGLASFSAFQGAFLTSYAIQLGFSTSAALAMTLAGTTLALLMLPVSARLSDKFGRRRLVTTGVLLMILSSCAVFPALDTRQPVLSIAAVAMLWVAHSVAYGPSAA